MRIPTLVAVLVFAAGGAGCGRVESPLPRLQKDSSLVTDKVIVRSCLVNGIDHTIPNREFHATRGEQIDLAGQLARGTLGISGIVPHWTEREGEPLLPLSQAKSPNDPFLTLLLHVHGNDTSANLGVIETQPLEVRPADKAEDGAQFRARLHAPKRSGTYVIDMQVLDEASETPKRGEVLTKAVGFPIWRIVLNVR